MKEGIPCAWVLRPAGTLDEHQVRAPICSACRSETTGRPHQEVLLLECGVTTLEVEAARKALEDYRAAGRVERPLPNESVDP